MKSILISTLVVFLPHFAIAEDYGVDRIIASSSAARAASEFLLDVNDVKDRPFTVQVASHLNEIKAVEHVKELKGQQESAFYYPNFIKNQVYFKVCVGRFVSKAEADMFIVDFVKRTSETFSNVISLHDRPGADKKATAAQVTSADTLKKKVQSRSIASISDKKINLIKEVDPKAVTVASNLPLVSKPAEARAGAADSTKPAAGTEAAAETEAAAVTETTAATAAKTYSVQIAAYPYEEMAKVATAKVDAQGKDVFYRPALVNGKTWYRLYVGKFDKFNDATAFKKEIEQTYDSPIVRKLHE